MFPHEGARGFLSSAAAFLPSLVLHGLGKESKSHPLCCGEGFLVSGKGELMGLILKDKVRFFPLFCSLSPFLASLI